MKYALCALMFVSCASATKPVLIHPLGDSITRGFDGEGYRAPLFELLKAKNVDFHFVGSLETGPSSLPEKAHDGHNGAVTEHLSANIENWLAKYHPDVILLMIGANDIEAGAPVDQVLARIKTLLERIGKAAPKVRVLLSEITVIRDAHFNAEARLVNAKLSSFAGDNVTFVPMHDAISVDDLRDLDHPRPRGNKKIAERWMLYLEPVLKQLQPPST